MDNFIESVTASDKSLAYYISVVESISFSYCDISTYFENFIFQTHHTSSLGEKFSISIMSSIYKATQHIPNPAGFCTAIGLSEASQTPICTALSQAIITATAQASVRTALSPVDNNSAPQIPICTSISQTIFPTLIGVAHQTSFLSTICSALS